MKDEMVTVTIHDKICHIYRNCGGNGDRNIENYRVPVFYWGVGGGSRDSVETVTAYLRERIPHTDFLLAAYESENWNDDFSPWPASAVFGKEGFGGKAGDTLGWLTEYCMPYVEADTSEIARFPVGYSLAGLFSLWVYCECELFAGAVSCSGSLWYEGWLEYVKGRTAPARGDEINYLYLSLGDKEERTKNRLLSTVGGNTGMVYAMLCESQENVEGILEWNPGGHFSEPDVRIAKGIYWILKHFVV